jgi:hypothetical protein
MNIQTIIGAVSSAALFLDHQGRVTVWNEGSERSDDAIGDGTAYLVVATDAAPQVSAPAPDLVDDDALAAAPALRLSRRAPAALPGGREHG